MFRPVRSAALLSLLLGAGACADFLGTGDSTPSVSQALTAAFTTVPAEFSNNTSSFGGDSDGVPSLWLSRWARLRARGADGWWLG
ncbi:MAG: hypothetical protein IPN16_13725 [Gemmatimonadetes bacterium]|nr:hypothetical protein [Gemmatimonadota bacterium]